MEATSSEAALPQFPAPITTERLIVDDLDDAAHARALADNRLPRIIRKQIDARHARAAWMRAAIRRVWTQRARAIEIFEGRGVPCMVDGKPISKRKVFAIDPDALHFEIISALFDRLCAAESQTLPVVVVDRRAFRGVFIVRLPLDDGAR